MWKHVKHTDIVLKCLIWKIIPEKSILLKVLLIRHWQEKEALIQVYKGDEPSDFNNEYVGKVTINDDGTFSHKFVCRQEISEKTGDYKVMMAIEGGDKPFYLETIEAPKPQYKVVFKDMDGNIIDTQTVKKGNSATAPKSTGCKKLFFCWLGFRCYECKR